MFIVEIAHSFDEIVISLQMNYVYLCIANLGGGWGFPFHPP